MASLGLQVDAAMKSGASPEELDVILSRVRPVHDELNKLESEFSNTLGVAARWAQSKIFLVLLLFSFIAAGVTLFLSFLGARMITKVKAHAKKLEHEHWLKSGTVGPGRSHLRNDGRARTLQQHHPGTSHRFWEHRSGDFTGPEKTGSINCAPVMPT